MTALQSYLSDSSVFSDQEASFRQYNYYLNKVIYGDVSWRIAEPRATVLTEAPSATEPAPPSSSDPEDESFVDAGTQEGASISASVVTAVPLAFVAVVGLVRLSARGHARRNRSEHLAPYCRDDGKRNS